MQTSLTLPVIAVCIFSTRNATAQVKTDFHGSLPGRNIAYQKTLVNPMEALAPCQVSLLVSNYEETVYWYEQKPGFKKVRSWEAGHLAYKAACLELNGFQIEIYESQTEIMSDSTPAHTGAEVPLPVARTQFFQHIAFRVYDLDSVVMELKYRKVEFLWEPIVDYDDETKVCYIKDNNGNPIKLVEYLE